MNGPQDQQLNIQANPEDLKGKYVNLMVAAHSKEEFILDFLFNSPQGAMLAARIVTSPGHAKRVARVLGEQVKAYEQQFGKIEEAEDPKGKIGFGSS